MARHRPIHHHHRRLRRSEQQSINVKHNRQSLSKKGFHFFNIVSSSIIQDQRMRLPAIFSKKFGNDLSDVAVISDSYGCIWQVELMKTDGEIFFLKGWERFVEHHSISPGYFLVFRYSGNSKFHVLIFDMTGSEKSNECYSSIHDKSNQVREYCLLQNEEDSRTLSDRQGVEQEQTVNALVACAVPSQLGTGEENSNVKQATGLLDHAHPFFVVTMKRTYVTHSYSIIPMDFVKKYMARGLQNVTLEVSDRRRWHIGVLMYQTNCKLSSGWPIFAAENDLQVGNTCVFEMMDTNVFRVHIYRTEDDMPQHFRLQK